MGPQAKVAPWSARSSKGIAEVGVLDAGLTEVAASSNHAAQQGTA